FEIEGEIVMIALSMKDIEKYYAANKVLHGVSLEINEGEKVAIVGQNGCGKTTLFRLVAGTEKYDNGMLALKKGIRIGYLEQIPSGFDGCSAYEVLLGGVQEVMDLRGALSELEGSMSKEKDEVLLEELVRRYGRLASQYEAFGGYSIESRVEMVTNGLNIQKSMYDMEFGCLSGGEKTRILFARILIAQPELLLLDEPTNHLDTSSIEWLESFIRDYRGTVVIISHDRYFLDRAVDRIIEVEDGECQSYEGNYSYFVKEKERRLLVEFDNYQDQQKKIKKMEEAIKRFRDWGNRGDNEKFFRKAASIQKALDRMEKLSRPVLERKNVAISFGSEGRSGKDAVICEGLTKAYASRLLLSDAYMQVRFGERVGIIGDNGSGKSTLIKMLMGTETPDSGSIKAGANAKIGYMEQSIEFEDENRTILEEFRIKLTLSEGEARGRLARFLFYKDSVFKRLSGLSGGEKARLRLAELMYSDMNLLVLDEPTNHLDIATREALEEALEDYDGTIVFISHDRYFINRMAERLYSIEGNTLVEYCGNYDYYKEKFRAEAVQEEKKKESKPALSEKRPKVKADGGRKRLEELENSIAELEEEIRGIKASLDALEKASDYVFLQDTGEKLEEREAALEAMYEAWQELSESL
ncbi:MAG TPA: ABC-F type ribosomal protection protein, partial [Negativicutes bacterium]|nr:ABC-F type ribosomal protection protein [Negativicutes bacterium]